LALACVLAAVAGFIDAFVYQNVTPVFVANMSGNLIRLGMFAGDGERAPALAAGVAVLVFVGAVVASTMHHDRQLGRAALVRPNRLLAMEAAILLLLPLLLMVGDVGFSATPTSRQYPVLVLGALAMGIQTAALRRVGQVAVATTYGTGALVRIGEKLALGVRGADRAEDHRRRVTIAVLVVVVACYVAGAAVAATAGSSAPWVLLFPGSVVAAAALALHGQGRHRSKGLADVQAGPIGTISDD